MRYETRREETRGWYVVSEDGHLAHVPDPDTRQLRAAVFERRADADRCARELSRRSPPA